MTINALCKKTSTGIPSDGFSYVYPNYDSLTLDEKRIFINGINEQAYNYKKMGLGTGSTWIATLKDNHRTGIRSH